MRRRGEGGKERKTERRLHFCSTLWLYSLLLIGIFVCFLCMAVDSIMEGNKYLRYEPGVVANAFNHLKSQYSSTWKSETGRLL